MDAIFNRTSIRKYKQESLKKEEIDLILKAAFSAPSARNSQPWQFIVVENKDTLKDLSQMTPYASFLKDAAMGMVVCADKNKNDSLDYCQQDLAAATENMLVEAKSLGIGSCWLGVYPNEERYLALNQYFKLPKGIVPMWMIATVYKGNIIKNLIMDCQSYTKYRPNETTGGIFVSWRRKEELPTGA